MNRRQQDRALKDWTALKQAVEELDDVVSPVLLRGTFDTGQRLAKYDGKGKPQYAEQKTQMTSYNDSTGETAIKDEIGDSVHDYVMSMVSNIGNALNAAKQIMSITPKDVADRAKRDVPDCAACGDPVSGKLFYGRWDDKCRKRFSRWVDNGNAPDEKLRFEVMVQNERSDVHPS